MPKTLYINEHDHAGVDITYTKSTQKLTIGGWYDTMAGIQSKTMTLAEFFDKLGITEKDCKKVWENTK